MRRIAMVLMLIAVLMSTFAAHPLLAGNQHSAFTIGNPLIFKRPSLTRRMAT